MVFSPELVLSALAKARYAWLTSCDGAAGISCGFQHISVPGLSGGFWDAAWEQFHLLLSAPNSLLKYSFAITWGKNHQVTFSRTLDYDFKGRLPLEDSKLSVSPNFTWYCEHSAHLYGFVWAYYLYSTVLPIFTVEWKEKSYKMAEEGKQTMLLGLNNSNLFSIFRPPPHIRKR